MSRGIVAVAAVVCCLAGCPVDRATVQDDAQQIIPSDYDGAWRITSETGLVNRCITILGDRVTQIAECEGVSTLVADTEPSARSSDQIIWTFRTTDSGSDVLHTISVHVQPDGTLRGTYSLRSPGETFALTDRIIMARRQIRT